MLCACLVWFFVLPSVPYLLFIVILKFFPKARNVELLLDQCEESLLLDTGIRSRTFNAFNSQVHVLEKKSTIRSAMSVILIHGGFGSSIGFKPLIDSLSSNYNVYAIDLPGFGRSFGSPAKGESPMEFYVNVIASVITELDIDMPMILGHSFGAYVGIRFAKKYPQILGLVIMNPIGIFPTLGTFGAFHALRFKLGHFITRLLSMGGGPPVLSPRLFNPSARYWFYLATNPEAYGNSIVSEFIECSLCNASWKFPAYNDLGKLKCRVFAIYSLEDRLAEMHEAITIHKNLEIPLETLLFTGHYLDENNSRQASNAIQVHFRIIGSHPTRSVVDIDFSGYESSFYPQGTRSTIRDMYVDIQLANVIGQRMDDGI